MQQLCKSFHLQYSQLIQRCNKGAVFFLKKERKCLWTYKKNVTCTINKLLVCPSHTLLEQGLKS